jgi:hypothetical protein
MDSMIAPKKRNGLNVEMSGAIFYQWQQRKREGAKEVPVSALMASCKPGGLTTTVSALAVTTEVLSATLT